MLLSCGVYLMLTGMRDRDRSTLAERLPPYHHASVADEAEAWLRTRGDPVDGFVRRHEERS